MCLGGAECWRGLPYGDEGQRGLLALYGICRDMYREVGGADAFIRSQREDFGSVAPDYPDQENDGAREKIA